MEILLTQDVDKLGKKNDVVKVRDGYGRNYLIPGGFAVLATEGNKKSAAEILKQQQHKMEKMVQEMRARAEQLGKAVVKVGAKVGKDDKIFGSVTASQLADAIKAQTGIEVDRKMITIPEEVKTTGAYRAKINLLRDVQAEVAFEVVAE